MPNIKVVCGQKYGRWLVLSQAEHHVYPKGGKAVAWNCQCECGTTRKVLSMRLTSGESKSCGCYQKEVVSGLHRINPKDEFWNRYINSFKSGAKRRNMVWELTTADVKTLAKNNCHFCGAPPSAITWAKNAYLLTCRTFNRPVDIEFANNKIESANSIDRIDNSVGYTLKNCVSACDPCNTLKSDLDLDEWYVHMQKILKHRGII